MALSALGLLANFLALTLPPKAWYKFNKAIPSSDGLMAIRASALVPVKLMPVSN